MSLRPDHPLASASASALDDPLEFLNALDPIPVEAVEPADVEELGTYGTCQISDNLLKLGVKTGGFIPDLKTYSTGLSKDQKDEGGCYFAGLAYTVLMVAGDNTTAPKLEGGHFIDQAPPGSVIFISSEIQAKSAFIGGLLGLAAKKRGVKGVVVDGGCRDWKEFGEIGLPLFAKHHTTLGQSPFTRPSAINIELPLHQSDRSCGWLTVPYSTSVNATREHTVRWEDQSIFPGDIIVGDSDGVVAVPHHWLQRVLEGCRKGKEVERLCREDLMAGRGVGETFKERRGK